MDKWVSNEQNIVVHCVCGVSRSATLVIGFTQNLILKPNSFHFSLNDSLFDETQGNDS